jgi:signal transduction histidine kinase
VAYNRTRRIYLEIAAIPVLLMVASFEIRSRYREDVRRVEHTREVQAAISDLLVDLSNAEIARRGFSLMGNAAYLAQIDHAVLASKGLVQTIRVLTKDNQTQQQNVQLLEGLVNRRAELLSRTAQFGGDRGTAAMRAAEREGGLTVSAELDDLARKMSAEEDRLWRIRKLSTDRLGWEENALFIAGSMATILLLMWAYRLVQQHARERDRAEALVIQANQQLEAKISQVDQLNKELEDRVRERTEDLERSNNDLQQFAYVASHDLQEPLRMIVSYVGLLGQTLQGKLDEETAKYMAFAVDGAKRMQALISDLLAYTRSDTQNLTLVRTPLEAVLNQARYNLAESIRESEAEITAGPLPQVEIDVLKVGLVFQNLISNAIKFRKSGERPRIHIAAEEGNGEWRISVRDEGIGFSPKYAEKIFVVFQRLHGPSQYPGTGIGLAICKRVIEGHGGRIWAESTPDAGATFCFTLPAQERSRRTPAKGNSISKGLPPSKKTGMHA